MRVRTLRRDHRVDAGDEETRDCGPWEFDVEYADGEREGETIETGDMTPAEIDVFETERT
jgi:hypothetical protein